MQLDKTPVVETFAVRKMYLAAAMGKMCESAVMSELPWTRMVVYEADMMPPHDALTRIAAYPDDQLDIVGAVYFQHSAPHAPVFYDQTDEEHFKALHRSQVDEMMAAPGLYPVDAVGMGFTSIHRRVLQNWDPDVLMWGGETELGHDMWFCREAKRQGFTVHVDSGIACGHLTEVPITYDNTKQ
jgi:hypothetical protein